MNNQELLDIIKKGQEVEKQAYELGYKKGYEKGYMQAKEDMSEKIQSPKDQSDFYPADK